MESLPESPLRAWRVRAGWTQSRLARRLKVAEGTISRWERGIRFPEQQYHRPLYELSEGEITPNSFAHWLSPSQSAAPLASPTPSPRRRGRRHSKEANNANPTEAAAA